MCLLHSYRIVMGVGQTEADRGYQIKEELLLDFCSLEVKPGARMKSRMTSAEVKKTKDVANLRIHVESAINRIRSFRILKILYCSI